MNELVNKSGGALAAVQALKGNLKKVQAALPETQNSQYLRFLQDGSWVFGQENEEVLPEDRIALNTMSIKTGWSCWTDRPKGAKANENLGEAMVPLGQDPLPKHELPVKKDVEDGNAVCEWKEQISVDVKFLTGPHKGKQVHYKTTSVGGISAMRAVIDQIIMQLDEDEANIVPIITLDGDHYQHKKYGRTYTPVVRIVDWMGLDGPDMTATKEVEKPASTRRVAKEEAPAADDDVVEGTATREEPDDAPATTPEPTRRRRR